VAKPTSPTSPAKTGGDAPAVEEASVEDPATPAIEAPEQPVVSDEAVRPGDATVDKTTPEESKLEAIVPETTQPSDEVSRDITTESPAAVPDATADDLFAPTSSKKNSKKAKKGKQSQTAFEEPVEDLPAEPAPAGPEDTEVPAAEGVPAEDATPGVPATSVNDLAAADPSPPDDDWASTSTSKKGKKAKKGKKQKADDWTEPEAQPEQIQGATESDTAVAPADSTAESPLAVGDEPQVKPETETAKDLPVSPEPSTGRANPLPPTQLNRQHPLSLQAHPKRNSLPADGSLGGRGARRRRRMRGRRPTRL